MGFFSFIGDVVNRTLTNAGPISGTIVKNRDNVIGCYLVNKVLTVFDSQAVIVSPYTFASPYSYNGKSFYFLVNKNGTDHILFPGTVIRTAHAKVGGKRFTNSLSFWGKCLEESGIITPDLGEPIFAFQSWAGRKEKVPVLALHGERLMNAYLEKLSSNWILYEIV